MPMCKICGETKPVEEFWRKKSGYIRCCKTCRNKQRREDYKQKKLAETRDAKKAKA